MILKELPEKRLEPKYRDTQTLKFSYIGSYSKAEAMHGLKQQPEELYKSYEDELVFNYDIPMECAKHLVHSYGTMAIRVASLGELMTKQSKGKKNFNERIHPDYPFLRSELYYSAQFEMAEKPNDILCRRVPIAMLNKEAGLKLIPETVEILAKERKWNST